MGRRCNVPTSRQCVVTSSCFLAGVRERRLAGSLLAVYNRRQPVELLRLLVELASFMVVIAVCAHCFSA